MKCEKCGKNEANTYYRETINGQTREMHLCSECAKEMHIGSPFEQAFAGMQNEFGGFFAPFTPFPSLFQGGSLLSDMMSGGLLGGAMPDTERRCPKCGTTLRDIQRTGRAGCPDCYHVFEDVLNPYIQKVQGADSHIGSTPKTDKNPVESLNEKLQEAIKSENYEEAARLRDEIRRQEGK